MAEDKVMTDWLKEAMQKQEPVEIIYMSGSRPGFTRKLMVVEVFKYKYYAYDVTDPDKAIKSFTVAATLRVMDLPPEEVKAMNDDANFIYQKFENFEDLVAKTPSYFEDKGFRVVIKEDSYEILPLNKRKRRPLIGLYFDDMVVCSYDELAARGVTINPETGQWIVPEGVSTMKKTMKHWLLKMPKSKTRFEIFDNAATKFLANAVAIVKQELAQSA